MYKVLCHYVIQTEADIVSISIVMQYSSIALRGQTLAQFLQGTKASEGGGIYMGSTYERFLNQSLPLYATWRHLTWDCA